MPLEFSNRIHMFDADTALSFWIESLSELGAWEIGMERDGVVLTTNLPDATMKALMRRLLSMMGAVQAEAEDPYPDY